MRPCCCDVAQPGGGGGWGGSGVFYLLVPCGQDADVNSCCPFPAAGCPDLWWSQDLLLFNNVPLPQLPENLCFKVQVNCCTYRLTSTFVYEENLPGNAIVNVGVVVYNDIDADCCDSKELPTPTGCLRDQLAAFACNDIDVAQLCVKKIAKPYVASDQFGTVAGKELTVFSQFITCVDTAGAAPGTLCDNCPPITHQQHKIDNEQLVGDCIPIDAAAQCPGQRSKVVVGMLNCHACYPCGECCGTADPCEGLMPGTPDYDDFCQDPKNTYVVRTCYSVEPCNTYFEEDVFKITFPWCHSGVDPQSESASAELLAFYSTAIDIQTGDFCPSYFGGFDGLNLFICDAKFNIWSGSATHVREAVDSLDQKYYSFSVVTGRPDCWWFGTRQSCNPCAAGQRPPYRDGDELIFDRVEIDIFNGLPTVYLRGRSRQYRVCVSASYVSQLATTQAITQSMTSANCLSIPEFACGMDYDLEPVEVEYLPAYICTAANPTFEVIGCDAFAGYPLYDVVVNGVTVQQGFITLCGGFPIPKHGCRSYPFLYSVCPCETVNCPTICNGVYQDPGYYCESFAYNIELRRA